MGEIEHASINEVEIHNLAEQDCEEDLLYTGDIFLNGMQAGHFREVLNGDIEFDIKPNFRTELQKRVRSYLHAIADEGENADELSEDIFYLDLIEREQYLQLFEEGKREGYQCLLINYTEDSADPYSFSTREEAERAVEEEGFEAFQIFSAPEDFIINV